MIATLPAVEIRRWKTSKKSIILNDSKMEVVPALNLRQNNHFTRMIGDKWDEFVGSIREFGIITPLIIRSKGDRYEIIAGHNRKYGAIEAGLTKVPCILTDLDDVDASVWIGVTNTQREKVSDLEWGWTYRAALEAVKRQRDGSEETENAAGGQAASSGEKSIDIVAKKFGINRKTAQRKIRLTYLLPKLYEYCMNQGASQEALIDLSYLSEEAQWKVIGAIDEGFQITEELTKQIRILAENGEVTNDATIIWQNAGRTYSIKKMEKVLTQRKIEG